MIILHIKNFTTAKIWTTNCKVITTRQIEQILYGCRIVGGVGQYFMTNDNEEFSQFRTAACREYTLPRDEDTSEPKGWIRGNTKIGAVMEVTTWRQFSLLGQNFSWLKQVCHEFEQQ